MEIFWNKKENLAKFADKVQEKLSYFNELDTISQLFSRANLSVLDVNFLDALKKLDKSIEFINEHPSYRENRIYLLKFRQLQTRGLSMIKSYLVASLRNLSKQIQSNSSPSPIALRSSNNPEDHEEFENKVYLKFKQLATSLRPLCLEIEKRVEQKEYQSLLSDCHYCYFQQRYQLLYQNVQYNINQLSKNADLSSLIRSGSNYLLRLCQNEFDLYKLFFSSFSSAMRFAFLFFFPYFSPLPSVLSLPFHSPPTTFLFQKFFIVPGVGHPFGLPFFYFFLFLASLKFSLAFFINICAFCF